jgi:hypothetical protein
LSDYLAVFRGRAALRCGAGGVFGFQVAEACEVRVTDWWQESKVMGASVHLGLEYRAFLRGSSALDALTTAEASVELVGNMLAAVHATAVGKAHPHVAIELVAGRQDRQWAQKIEALPSGLSVGRAFDYEATRAFMGRWNAIAEEKASNEQITRGLWHLRKAVFLDDLFEVFNELWQGLECLSPRLQIKHGLTESETKASCPKCGEPVQVMMRSSGAKFAATKLAGLSPDEWKDIYQIRQKIQHGAGTVGELGPRLPLATANLRRAVIAGLTDLLGCDQDLHEQMLLKPVTPTDAPGITLEGIVHDASENDVLSAPSLPHMVVAGARPPKPGSAGGDVHPILQAVSVVGRLTLTRAHLSRDGRIVGGSLLE